MPYFPPALAVKDEGVAQGGIGQTINFVGSGVTATVVAGVTTVTVPGGAGATTGTAVLDFGTGPGNNQATILVPQAAVGAGSIIKVFMMAEATASHNAYEHAMVEMKLTAGTIIAGVSFVITGVSSWRLSGTFNVRYEIG